MRTQVIAGLSMLGLALAACGGDEDPAELDSTRAVAEQIPGCEDTFEDVSDNNGYPEIIDARGACTYEGERLFIDLFADADAIEPHLSSLPNTPGVTYLSTGRWVVQVPSELADGLADELGGDVQRIQ